PRFFRRRVVACTGIRYYAGMDAERIRLNIANVRKRVSIAAEKVQRRADDITLMAVSKTRSADEVRAAVAAGIRDLGENYLQEALEKIATTGDVDARWHFIGPIQSNKTRAIAEHFDWVHSVDREKIARRLNDQRPDKLPPMEICLQVNVSGEESKSGVAPDDLAALASAILQMPRLHLRGLMAIPAPTDDVAAQRAAFARVTTLFSELQGIAPQMDTLSMGMSADLDSAIAENATMVRVGTDIFGPRAG
ncbi:MAG: YggS family pyridoxal phosphate-dependent enzyme, partial [Chromatocurvus sp.]